jgi:hypothetical protein
MLRYAAADTLPALSTTSPAVGVVVVGVVVAGGVTTTGGVTTGEVTGVVVPPGTT